MILGRHVHHIDSAFSNDVRWGISSAAKDEEIRDYALLIILIHARDNIERWRVFRSTQDWDLREDALSAMVPHATRIEDLWKIYCCTTESMGFLRDRILGAVEVLQKEVPRIQWRNRTLSLPQPKKHDP